MGTTTFIDQQPISKTTYTEVNLPFEEIDWLGGGLYVSTFPTFRITTNSVASSIIVVNDNAFPPAQFGITSSTQYIYTASLDFQEHISASSNVIIPIKAASQVTQQEIQDSTLTKICIGESIITDLLKTESLYTEISSSLQTEQFLIYGIQGSILAIIANDAPTYPATHWGVCELLERIINAKWIFPGDSGRYYDSKSTIDTPSVAYTWKPNFAYRQIAQYVKNNQNYNRWLLRHRIPEEGQGAPSTTVPNKGACLANVGFNDWDELYGNFVLNSNSESADFNKIISVPPRVDAVIKNGRYIYWSDSYYDPRYPKGISIFNSSSILNDTQSYLNLAINDQGIAARFERYSPGSGAGNENTQEYYSNTIYLYSGSIDTGSNGSMIGRYGYPGIPQYPWSGSHFGVVKSYDSASGFYSSSWNETQTPRNIQFTWPYVGTTEFPNDSRKFNQKENFQELLIKHWISGSTVIPTGAQRGEFNPILGYDTINAPTTSYFFMSDTDGLFYDITAEESFRPGLYTSSLGAYIESGSSRLITFKSGTFLDTTTFEVNSLGISNRTERYIEWWITASQNINNEAINIYNFTSSVDFGVLAYQQYLRWPNNTVPDQYKNALENFYISVVTSDSIEIWNNWLETGAKLFWRPNLWYKAYPMFDWEKTQQLYKSIYQNSVGFAIDSGNGIASIIGHDKYIFVRSLYKEKTSEEFLLEWAQYFTPNTLTDYNSDKITDPVVNFYDYLRTCRDNDQTRTFREIFSVEYLNSFADTNDQDYIPRTRFLLSPTLMLNYNLTNVQYSIREGLYNGYPLYSSKPQEVMYNQLSCVFSSSGDVMPTYPNYVTNPNTLLTSESFDVYYTLQNKYNNITSSAYSYGDPTYITRSLWLHNGWKWQERRVDYGNRVVDIAIISGSIRTPYNDTSSISDFYIPIGNYYGDYYSNQKYPNNTTVDDFITTESQAAVRFIESGSTYYPESFGSSVSFARGNFGYGFDNSYTPRDLFTP